MKLINVEKDLVNDTAVIAKEIFIDHFKDIIGVKQAEYMVENFLSKKAIEEELAQGTVFKLCEEENEYVAFSEYKIENDYLFLSKLYVLKTQRGKGIAKALLNDAIEYARSNNLKSIRLTVNKYNYNTIEIYKHWGFEIIDSFVKEIGNGYVMDDYYMEKKIWKSA